MCGPVYIIIFPTSLLILADEEYRKAPLHVTLTPLNKTTPLLEWNNPNIYDNNTYEVVLSIDQNYQETVELHVIGSSVLLNLEGQECQPFQVNISIPDNNVIITGSLLIGNI